MVQIFVTGFAPPDEDDPRSGRRSRSSSAAAAPASIVDADGYIVTNAHVVENATRIEVELPFAATGGEPGRSILGRRGRTVGAQIVAIDHETDLAVVKVEAKALPALAFGDSDALRPGQLVLAFGSPLGLDASVTLGIVSAVARQLTPEDPMIYIQTDAPINPGNSGGALVDTEGRLVGINTLIYSQSGGSEGIGFAAPSNIVRNVFEQIRKTGRVRRGEIGVTAQTVTATLAEALKLPADAGVIVADVEEGGPGAKAGLRPGDIVLSLDGKRMENGRQFRINLYTRAIGQQVTLEIQRGGRRLDGAAAGGRAREHVHATERSADAAEQHPRARRGRARAHPADSSGAAAAAPGDGRGRRGGLERHAVLAAGPAPGGRRDLRGERKADCLGGRTEGRRRGAQAERRDGPADRARGRPDVHRVPRRSPLSAVPSRGNRCSVSELLR